MKEKNTQTKREQSSNSLTQINTLYARICVILLALNFCITGYVLIGVLKLQQESVAMQTHQNLPNTQVLKQNDTRSPFEEGIKTLEKE